MAGFFGRTVLRRAVVRGEVLRLAALDEAALGFGAGRFGDGRRALGRAVSLDLGVTRRLLPARRAVTERDILRLARVKDLAAFITTNALPFFELGCPPVP